MPLGIESKMNVYKAYVRSIYILFLGGCKEASKLVLLNKSYKTIKCSKSPKETPKQVVKLVQVQQ